MKAILTKNIHCHALGLTILKGIEFEIINIGKSYSICKDLPITMVWNDEYIIMPQSQ